MIGKSLYRAYWGIFGCNFPLYYRVIEILMGGSYDNHTGTGEQLTRDRLKLYQPMIWWWVRLVVNSILESLMKGIITCGYAQKPIETLPPGTPPSNTLVQAQLFSIHSASGFCDRSYLLSIHAEKRSTFHQSFWERFNESQNFMDFGDPSLISTCYFVAFISRAYEPHKPRIPQVSFGKKQAWACLFAYLWKSTRIFEIVVPFGWW